MICDGVVPRAVDWCALTVCDNQVLGGAREHRLHPKDTSHPHGRVDVHVHFGVKDDDGLLCGSAQSRTMLPWSAYNLWMEHLDHARDGPPWVAQQVPLAADDGKGGGAGDLHAHPGIDLEAFGKRSLASSGSPRRQEDAASSLRLPQIARPL